MADIFLIMILRMDISKVKNFFAILVLEPKTNIDREQEVIPKKFKNVSICDF
jgi:hypothetical protein